MKIWVIEIGEPLPVDKSARLLRYGNFTKIWASQGHQVTWWTSSFIHSTKIQISQSDEKRVLEGVNLHILYGKGYRKNVSISRILHHRKFAKKFYSTARQLLQKGNKPDIIICSLPTLENVKVAEKLATEFDIPIIIDIRDEWPDELFDLFREPLRTIVAHGFQFLKVQLGKVCKNASGLTAVSKRFLKYGLDAAGRAESISDKVIPLAYSSEITVDENQIRVAEEWWIKNHGIDKNAFICCLFASLGPFFELKPLIRATQILSEETNFQMVLCGHGSMLKELKKLTKNIPSVILPGWVDAPKIHALMRMASVGLAPYKENARMTLPNKAFEYFYSGLPVISTLRGELEEILNESGSGITYSTSEEFITIIRKLIAQPNIRKEMGKKGQQLFIEKFSAESVAQDFLNHLTFVVNKNPSKS